MFPNLRQKKQKVAKANLLIAERERARAKERDERAERESER